MLSVASLVRSVGVYSLFVGKERHGRVQVWPGPGSGPRSSEVPQWMFDRAACRAMRVADVPAVRCKDLLQLQELLRLASTPDAETVLQDQHRPSLLEGDADEKTVSSSTICSVGAVSSASRDAQLANASSRDQTKNNDATGATAPRASRRRRLQRRGGGDR